MLAYRYLKIESIKPARLVDKTAESGIINTKTTGTAVNDVYSIGKIDVEKYQNIADKRILTNEVIITDNRIEHIIQRRGQNFYVEYHEYFSSIIEDPDYIFKAIPHKPLKIRKKNGII